MSIVLMTSLIARENPFFADKDEKDIIVSSNQDNTKIALKRATITLPSEARILQKVTIEYKNIDGSIDKKSIVLDNSVNWHLPIFISQSYNEPKAYNLTKQKKIKNYKAKYKKIGYKDVVLPWLEASYNEIYNITAFKFESLCERLRYGFFSFNK